MTDCTESVLIVRSFAFRKTRRTRGAIIHVPPVQTLVQTLDRSTRLLPPLEILSMKQLTSLFLSPAVMTTVLVLKLSWMMVTLLITVIVNLNPPRLKVYYHAIVASQNCTIQRLSNKLNVVFSMFDLTEDDLKLNNMVASGISAVPLLDKPSLLGSAVSPSTAASVIQDEAPTFASIVKHSSAPATKMRQAVLTAVYRENEDKKSR